MYTKTFAKQVQHLQKKIREGTVYQFGDDKTYRFGNVDQMKSYLPTLVAPVTHVHFWEELGFEVITDNRYKADVVVVNNYLDETLDIKERITEAWNKCKVGGYILFEVMSGISQNNVNIQPNLFTRLKLANESMGITYFNMGDTKGQHSISIDSSNTYGHSAMLDSLHKFPECRELVTNVTVTKTANKELVCP